MKRLRTILCGVGLLATNGLPAQASFSRDDAGTSAGNFLKLPVDARGAAMGGAMGAASNDVSALHWNPAGLAGLTSRQFMTSFLPYVQGAASGFIGFAQPLESLIARPRRELAPTGLGTLAFGVKYFNAGSLREIDNTGQPTGASFAPADVAVMGGWGGAVARTLDFGVGVKIIRSQIRASASTVAADAGARLRLRAGPVPYALSASVHDTFGHLKFREQLDPLPMLFRLGASAELLPVLTLTLGATAPRDNRPYFSLGTEVTYAVDTRVSFAARFGYDGATTRGQLEGLSAVTMGGGIGLYRATFDYAWQPYGALGDAHRLTLSYRF